MQKALIIDDSKAMRRILASAVREFGLEVSEAANGRQALETLAGMQPPAGIALVDWNMPEMNGLEFVNRVRANARWNGVKLMMVTSVTEADQMVKALTAGADEYIMKPFTKEALHDKLRLLGIVE
jgi:two-component system chemotaxis response regulator CheY